MRGYPSDTRVALPGYVVGTWDIDPVHSDVSFTVRHMMVSRVRGRFTKFWGVIITAPDPLHSSVTAEVDMSSIDTGDPDRDNHLRSSDFFDVSRHPQMHFQSTGLEPEEDDAFRLEGDLTIRGVTKRTALRVTANGFGPDAYGGTRAGFSATGTINRREFGVNWNAALEAGRVVVGDEVRIELEIEAVLRATGNEPSAEGH